MFIFLLQIKPNVIFEDFGINSLTDFMVGWPGIQMDQDK